MLWHARFGAASRYGTARCATRLRSVLSRPDWMDAISGLMPPDIGEQISWDVFGRITGLPAATASIPWDGPRVRIVVAA